MKQNLLLFTLSVFLIINVTGCSVVRFTETRMMEGVKKINKTDLKLDFQLDYNPADHSLSINLAHQPYSIYKPKITLTDLGVGLAAVGIWGIVFYDNWDHDYTFDFTDDTFDWYDSEWWEKAVLIGVPADILFYWTFSYPIDRKMEKLNKQPLTNHPYRIELPDHGNTGNGYTTVTGIEQIDIKQFMSDIGNPSYLQNIDSLKFRVTTEVSGMQYKRYYTAPNKRDYTAPILPILIPTDVKIHAEWVKNPIRAGERAILKITMENRGKTVLTDLIATTVCSNPHFNNWEMPFGNIPQGETVTKSLGFSTEAEMSTKDITVSLSFKTETGGLRQKIEKKLTIIK